jgi:hypothetical protein
MIRLFLIILLTGFEAFAQDMCRFRQNHHGGVQVTVNVRCQLGIQQSRQDSFNRQYIMGTGGKFDVFVNMGDGPLSKTTGGRNYIFWPKANWSRQRTQNADGSVSVSPPWVSEPVVFQNSEVKDIRSMPGIRVRLQKVTKVNKGGIDLEPLPNSGTLMLSGGYHRGNYPFAIRNRSSTFYDDRAGSCEIPNTELFDYELESDGRTVNRYFFKYQSDQALRSFLRNRCKGKHALNLGMLNSGNRVQEHSGRR